MGDLKKTLQNSETLVFINECLPQLVAGNYTITADLTVNNLLGDIKECLPLPPQ